MQQFEEAFAKYHDAEHGICVTNGTTAIELALLTCGVQPGDEVLVPALTFIASASAIVRTGAVPVFVDSDPDTLAISAKAMEAAITPRTRGAVVVHYGGYPVDFDAALPVCKKHGLYLIEDCAHAQGTEWKGRKVGAIGAMGTFSFQETKSFAVGEGGIVLTDSDELFDKGMLIHNIGRHMGAPGYQHLINASNYRMPEIVGALALTQMEVFPCEVELRDSNGRYLADKLRTIGGVEPLPQDERITKRGYYFFIIKYNSDEFQDLPRDRFVEALNAEGVPCGSAYGVPLYKMAAFKSDTICFQYPKGAPLPDYENLHLPVAERFCSEQQVTLPQTLLLGSKKDMDLVADSIAKVKENAR